MDNRRLKDYEKSINTVLNYISINIGRNFSLDELAEVACFSKYHFHRIFKAMVGETLRDFIRRIQVEKGAYCLIFTPHRSITDIAYSCGFSSSQNFAKIFKKHYHLSPRDFKSKNGNIFRNTGKDRDGKIHYIDTINAAELIHLSIARSSKNKVEIVTLPDMDVVYFRQFGKYTPQNVAALISRTVGWGVSQGMSPEDIELVSVFWDNDTVTDDSKCRCDSCIVVPPEKNFEVNIHRQVLPGGKFAWARCLIRDNDYHEQWDWFLTEWLPDSGYVPDDRPSYEKYPNMLTLKEGEQVIMDIYLPVK